MWTRDRQAEVETLTVGLSFAGNAIGFVGRVSDGLVGCLADESSGTRIHSHPSYRSVLRDISVRLSVLAVPQCLARESPVNGVL